MSTRFQGNLHSQMTIYRTNKIQTKYKFNNLSLKERNVEQIISLLLNQKHMLCYSKEMVAMNAKNWWVCFYTQKFRLPT